MNNGQWMSHREKGGRYECFMDRQYQHIFIGDSDHHGFLSHNAVKRIDPMAEEGIVSIADCGIRIAE